MEKLNKIIDLHTHTLFSDGDLLPSEIIQRARKREYQVIGLTDHVDHSNYEYILDNLIKAKIELSGHMDIDILIGVEITHVAPSKIESLIYKCRQKGAQIVNVHGETIVEPVEKGTNEAAIKGGANILAHPGFISEKLAALARENHVFLELSYRKGHCLTNGYVAKVAERTGALISIDSDAHAPNDLFPDFETYKKIFLASGLGEEKFDFYFFQIKEFLKNQFGFNLE